MHYESKKVIPIVLRWKQLKDIIPWSRSHTYYLIQQGKFPKPFKLLPGGQASGWLASDIREYMQNLNHRARDLSIIDNNVV
jgi:predicted DNA-binding transcriptional regulator AlpA